MTLARQIIEATPERIKQEAPGGPPGALGALGSAGGTLGTPGTPGPAGPAGLGAAMAWLATYLESVDRPPAPPHRYSWGWGVSGGTLRSLGGSPTSSSTSGYSWGFPRGLEHPSIHWEGPLCPMIPQRPHSGGLPHSAKPQYPTMGGGGRDDDSLAPGRPQCPLGDIP